VWSDTRNNPGQTGEAFGAHMHGDGTLAAGWNVNGNLLAPGQPHRGICEDGDGGFYLWTTVPGPVAGDYDYFLRRFQADGTLAPGWPAGGLVVCDAIGDRTGLNLVPDGFGGVLATWYEYRGGGDEVYALRVLPNATLAPSWTVNGTTVSDPARQTSDDTPFVAADERGGAYIVWNENDGAEVQHLTANGQVAPGWPVGGLRVSTFPSQFDAHIAPDGEGGAIVAWNEGCCGHVGIFAQRYVMDGIVATQLSLVSASAEPDRVRLEWLGADAADLVATVYRRSESTAWASLARVSADGTGHLRYEDREVKAGERYAYRLGYTEDDQEQFTAETWVEVPAALELALNGFRPNPAVGVPTIAFTLPRSAPGRLELFDLAGRRVAERDLGSLPAGRHNVRFDLDGDLAPGAYTMRITHAGQAIRARGVIVR